MPESAPLPGEEIETPAALVDLDRVRRNAQRVVRYARGHGLAWRPHIKTHKSLTVARIQLEEGAAGLTVATLKEGEVMADVSSDLLLAYPPIGHSRAARLARLAERARITVALDSEAALTAAAAAGRIAGAPLRILVELDVGMGRVGLGDPDRAAELARRIQDTEGTEFAGLMFYPGHIRMPAGGQDEVLRKVADRLRAVYERLESTGTAPEVVSGGSSPTLWRSHELPGLTEIRSGTVIFNDRDMVELGVCREDDVAYHVLATVISTAVPGRAVVDAGSKALAKEEFRAGGGGYGRVAEHPEVLVAALSEEHGILDLSGTDWRPRVGDRIRIVPNHVCVSVNLQDRLLAPTAGGFQPVELEARGRLPAAGSPLAPVDTRTNPEPGVPGT